MQTPRTCSRLYVAAFVSLLLFGHFAYFQHSLPGWNVNSRLNLTLALARDGTTNIGKYANRLDTETGDIAVWNGQYYSDKAIGLSLLGVPAMRTIDAAADVMDRTVSIGARRTWLTILTVSLLGAIGGGAFFLLLSRINDRFFQTNDRASLIVALGVFGGTVLTLYGSLYMSYLPATAFLILSFAYAERTIESSKLGHAVAAGMLAGIGVLCEYLFGVVAVTWALTLAWRKRSFVYVLLFGLGGAVTTVLPLVVYLLASFGGLHNPYLQHANPEFREGMSRGLMGATYPDFDALILLTVHPYKGLFVHSCFLLCALPGLWFWLQRKDRAVVVGSLLIVAFYLLFNSAYYMWWGGWSFGPRHLIPMLPFLGILMLPVLQNQFSRWLIIAVVAVAILLHALVAAVEPQLPDSYPGVAVLTNPDMSKQNYPNPFAEYIWPKFWSGPTDQNLGNVLFGLPRNALSLIPWMIWWVGLGCIAWRMAGKSKLMLSNSDKVLS